MENIFLIAQILIAIVVIILVVLQTQSSGAGGMFGGGGSTVYRTKRGLEKTLYQLTIGVAILFFVLSIISAMLH